MPENLMVAAVATLFCLVIWKKIRFFLTYFSHGGMPVPKQPAARTACDPYRNNPEVDRDRERDRANSAEEANAKLKSELTEVRMERDLAKQDNNLRVLRGRAKLGSAFALGAITCFTSVNVAPQVAHDLLSERPVPVRHARSRVENRPTVRDDLVVGLLTMGQRYYPYYSCAPHTCCHRYRLRIHFSPEFTLRLEPTPIPIQFFWIHAQEVSDLLATSGGEEPLNDPQDPQPVWIDRYAIATARENVSQGGRRVVVTMTLD